MEALAAKKIHILLPIILFTSYVSAADRLVPSAYPTIQSAISAANPAGDTVVISPGTYSGSGNSNIYVSNKSIIIRSTNPEDSNISGSTIIDGFDISAGTNPLFNINSNSSITIDGITIVNCYDNYGGAIEASDSSLTLQKCIFEDCIAWGDGGTIKIHNSKIIMDSCKIISSTAQGRGGAIFADYHSDVKLINCDFIDNWSFTSGGAVYIADQSLLSISGCNFNYNKVIGSRSEFCGGAVCISNGGTDGSNVSITDSCFEDNFAAGYGGCIYTRSHPLNINRCSFIKNISQFCGSAVWCDTVLKIVNSVFAGNVANSGIIYNSNVSLDANTVIRNCTFADNTVSYALLDLYGSNIEISNSIFWGLAGKAVFAKRYPVSFIYNDVEGNSIPPANVCIGNISINPDFVRPGVWNNGTYIPGDYKIALESPLINLGDPNTIIETGETDIEGNQRIRLGRIDIGAYEQGTHKMDFNEDGFVNFVDFAEFAEGWLWRRTGI